MPPKPILVTGSNRSGTTWTGKMIASSDEVFYVEEPFNYQMNKKYNLIPCPFTSHYHFVTNKEVEVVKNYLNYRIRRFYPWWLHIKTRPNLQNVNIASRLWLKTNYRLMRGLRPLVKDPIAIMSAEWLYKEFDMDVVIIVRSPLAYVSSIKRLGWSMSPGMFLMQKELMGNYLAPLTAEIQAQVKNKGDLIGDAIVSWKVFYYVVSIYKQKYPNWLIVRHEDLSLDPMNQFSKLFEQLSLSFTEKQYQVIKEFCNESNPAEAGNKVHQLKRNSKANIDNWKTRLTPDEISRVKTETYKIARFFYTDKELYSISK